MPQGEPAEQGSKTRRTAAEILEQNEWHDSRARSTLELAVVVAEGWFAFHAVSPQYGEWCDDEFSDELLTERAADFLEWILLQNEATGPLSIGRSTFRKFGQQLLTYLNQKTSLSKSDQEQLKTKTVLVVEALIKEFDMQDNVMQKCWWGRMEAFALINTAFSQVNSFDLVVQDQAIILLFLHCGLRPSSVFPSGRYPQAGLRRKDITFRFEWNRGGKLVRMFLDIDLHWKKGMLTHGSEGDVGKGKGKSGKKELKPLPVQVIPPIRTARELSSIRSDLPSALLGHLIRAGATKGSLHETLAAKPTQLGGLDWEDSDKMLFLGGVPKGVGFGKEGMKQDSYVVRIKDLMTRSSLFGMYPSTGGLYHFRRGALQGVFEQTDAAHASALAGHTSARSLTAYLKPQALNKDVDLSAMVSKERPEAMVLPDDPTTVESEYEVKLAADQDPIYAIFEKQRRPLELFLRKTGDGKRWGTVEADFEAVTEYGEDEVMRALLKKVATLIHLTTDTRLCCLDCDHLVDPTTEDDKIGSTYRSRERLLDHILVTQYHSVEAKLSRYLDREHGFQLTAHGVTKQERYSCHFCVKAKKPKKYERLSKLIPHINKAHRKEIPQSYRVALSQYEDDYVPDVIPTSSVTDRYSFGKQGERLRSSATWRRNREAGSEAVYPEDDIEILGDSFLANFLDSTASEWQN